ncbi:uncharacterized protein CBL_02180 [Carabus blaptoides fortunei]
MITPRFSLTQDDTFLTVNIRAPYCSLKELEVSIDGQDFRFICSPFYLRLNLPGRIVDNDAASGEFLSDKGEFVFKYAKEIKGEYFEGLQLITSLLAPSKKTVQVPQIEVLAETSTSDVYSTADDSEWYINQEVPTESDTAIDDLYKYGFANQKYDVLRNTEAEYYSVFEIRDVEKMSTTDRKLLRHDTEAMKFSYEHYLADYFDDEIVKTAPTNPWSELDKVTVSFTDKERDILKDLPNREYLLNEDEVHRVLNSLLDILYAYCYDKRTTHFESNCESGWTIARLSATLSWFDQFASAKDALISGYRRSLIYPLYRSFDLCTEVLNDLRLCLNLGTVFIVKCLLDIYDIFNTSSEPMYILNELYIKDYIIFMQKCPRIELDNVVLNVAEANVTLDDVKLNLNEIVADAIRNCLSGETILDKMSKLNISTDSETDSESDSSDESSTDSDDYSSS